MARPALAPENTSTSHKCSRQGTVKRVFSIRPPVRATATPPRRVARRTLAEAKRIFPEVIKVGESDIRSAWSGRVYYTPDDYPFVERSLGGRLAPFAAPSDHGNSRAVKVGQLAGDLAAALVLGLKTTGRQAASGNYPPAQTL